MLYDFHTHTCLSDGALSPCELIRRAKVAGYAALALTDHVGRGSLARLVREIATDCALAEAHWGLTVLAGVELTHVPAAAIDELAREAKDLGAEIVVVHGESPVEPVEPGTNRAAASSRFVDIIAHPGLLDLETAQLAAANGIFLELSARGGHNAANGHLAKVGREAGALFLVDSDTHAPGDLLSLERARMVALGAGLTEQESRACLAENPLLLLKKVRSCSRP